MNFITRFIKKAQKTAKAISEFRKFAELIKPTVKFDPATVPPAYVYSDINSWASHKDSPGKSTFTPEGIALNENPEADVFYVYPTLYFGSENWNQSPEHQVSRKLVDEVVIPGQASVFNGACRIYAPRYRMATFYNFLTDDPDGKKALELAYSDVKAAFNYYLEHLNDDRPFFLAGHSQGSLHLYRLIEECIDPFPDRVQKMVAAYPIGFQFPKDKFGRTIHNIKPSRSALDLHTIISWDTFGEPANPKSKLDRAAHYYPDSKSWELRYKKQNFGINPLTWNDATDAIDSTQNLGAVYTNFKGKYSYSDWWMANEIHFECENLSAPLRGEVGARLKKDGFLYIPRPQHRQFTIAMLPGNNYHNYDYGLFYMNLRENIVNRFSHYKATNSR